MQYPEATNEHGFTDAIIVLLNFNTLHKQQDKNLNFISMQVKVI